MVQKFYPEYLAEKSLPDHPFTRLGFYMAAVEELKETPLPDPMAQDLALRKLRIIIHVTVKEIMPDIPNYTRNK
jgi:hypothetical protein